MAAIKKGVGIQSLELGFSILEFVSLSGRAVSFTEIQEGTKITKSNLYKYLNTLTALELLYRDKYSGNYSLGSKLVEYGMKAINQDDVMEKITPYLQDISQACKETVFFAIWTHNGPMIIRMINSNRTLNVGAQIGSYLPALSATGAVFAAFMEEYLMEEWRSRELSAMGDKEQRQFSQELDEIKKKGMSYRSGSLVPSIAAVAAPIFNYQNKLLGVISLVGFTESISANEDDEKNQYLKKVCQEISLAVGKKKLSPE